MVEDTPLRNFMFDSINKAIDAENNNILKAYAKKHDRSLLWVKQQVEKNPQFLQKSVRYKARNTVTSGQYAQMRANLSHSKVYSKASAMALVSKIAPNIRNRSFEALSNQLWEGLNTYTTIDDKTAFAADMSEIFIDRMMVDTLTPNPEWE